eukprot:CAMPEP_0184870156 /NCGR_PEP_ID=MMETSP0580-20130426/36678_1 /TAXON_ID=1118495 /ORGANISM="Dactyliosolen fragilissimus" /LENGTH=640 /DNA_ID=CAMNT_0027372111 /DNA_START=139 /DNA_END=2061 /DNA_ORIENTATION=+
MKSLISSESDMIKTRSSGKLSKGGMCLALITVASLSSSTHAFTTTVSNTKGPLHYGCVHHTRHFPFRRKSSSSITDPLLVSASFLLEDITTKGLKNSFKSEKEKSFIKPQIHTRQLQKNIRYVAQGDLAQGQEKGISLFPESDSFIVANVSSPRKSSVSGKTSPSVQPVGHVDSNTEIPDDFVENARYLKKVSSTASQSHVRSFEETSVKEIHVYGAMRFNKSKKKKKSTSTRHLKNVTASSNTDTSNTIANKRRLHDEKRHVHPSNDRNWKETAQSPPLNIGSEKKRRASVESMYEMSSTVPDSFIAFTGELHKESRISPNEEIELGTKTQEAVRLQSLYDKLAKKLDREPTDEEWCSAAGKINMEALRQTIEDGIEAKNELVTANLRMVQGVVNMYIRNGLGSQYNAGDLMQDGTVALIRAAEKFEPKRGFRFSTYAMYWIRAAVKRSQILQSRPIYIPQRLHETHKKILSIERDLKTESGDKPSPTELAAAVGITEAQVERCLKALAQECFSLDADVENSRRPNNSGINNKTFHDLVEGKAEDSDYYKLKRLFLKEDLVDTLKRYLNSNEVDLLLLRYGLMDERTMPHGFSGPLTIAEVSRLAGLKPDKTRRIINSCLKQLRHLIAHEWEDFENYFS